MLKASSAGGARGRLAGRAKERPNAERERERDLREREQVTEPVLNGSMSQGARESGKRE